MTEGLAIWFDNDFEFAGDWHIRRVIRPLARFNGIARVESVGEDSYVWREEGLLSHSNGYQSNATRAYRYRFNRDAKSVFIDYADGVQRGEALHHFTGGGNGLRHAHVCQPDLYEAKLSIFAADRFQLSYAVTGPKKRYSISTIAFRVAS